MRIFEMDKDSYEILEASMRRAIRGSKYPMATETDRVNSVVTDMVNKLAFAPKGSAHDNWLCGIVVHFDVTFTVKAWTEAERYHWFEIVSSQSTMHRIARLGENENNFVDYVDPVVLETISRLIDDYNNETDETLKKEKYLKLLYSCPTGIKLTAMVVTNYQQLKTIYAQRLNHRLPEWRAFCQQLKELPHSEWITGEKNEHKTESE